MGGSSNKTNLLCGSVVGCDLDLPVDVGSEVFGACFPNPMSATMLAVPVLGQALRMFAEV
jgi:hypothetical protein